MTKIAIISQAEQGVLIDISGCSSLNEAKQYLTSTLQVSSQFWEGLIVDLNLGPLVLTPEQVNEIQAIVAEVGVRPRQIFSLSPITRSSLLQCRLPIADTSSAGFEPVSTAGANTLPATESTPATALSTFNRLPSQAAAVLDAGLDNDGIWLASSEQSVANLKRQSLPELFLNARNERIPEPVCNQQSNTQLPERELSNQLIPATLEEKLNGSMKTAASRTNNAGVLMMKQTLRSGQRVSHNGHLLIIGDVNPGAELVADGDITVWGALRGMAHAGAGGNTNAEIRALKFEAIQLRIAQAIARSPDRNKSGSNSRSGPETARVVDGKIRISGSDPELER